MTRREWRFCDRCQQYHDARNPADTCTQVPIIPPLAVAVVVVIGLAVAAFLWRWLHGSWA